MIANSVKADAPYQLPIPPLSRATITTPATANIAIDCTLRAGEMKQIQPALPPG